MIQLFIVRHADYSGGGPNPSLSNWGKEQSLKLAQEIKQVLVEGSVTIWSSSANRASETAEIIKQEMQLADMRIEDKLWSDNRHIHDFDWLQKQIENFKGDVLIIVSHLEYVREFPSKIGFRENNAGYAQGVRIQYGQCIDITY